MALSASTDFTLTARQIIEFALRKLRVLGSGETADADQAEDAMRELNLMLKGWQKYDSMWRLAEASQTLVADTANYTLTTSDPYRIVSARYNNGSSTTPLTILDRDDYYGLSSRTTQGTPTQIYVDRQRANTVLYVWPVLASATTEAISYTYQRKFQDVDSLDNDLDVRAEWLEVVGYNLAARLLPDYGRSGDSAALILQMAERYLQEALDDDRPDEIRFYSEYAVYSW